MVVQIIRVSSIALSAKSNHVRRRDRPRRLQSIYMLKSVSVRAMGGSLLGRNVMHHHPTGPAG